MKKPEYKCYRCGNKRDRLSICFYDTHELWFCRKCYKTWCKLVEGYEERIKAKPTTKKWHTMCDFLDYMCIAFKKYKGELP